MIIGRVQQALAKANKINQYEKEKKNILASSNNLINYSEKEVDREKER